MHAISDGTHGLAPEKPQQISLKWPAHVALGRVRSADAIAGKDSPPLPPEVENPFEVRGGADRQGAGQDGRERQAGRDPHPAEEGRLPVGRVDTPGGRRQDHLQCHLGDLPQLLVGLEDFRQHLGGRLTLTMLRGIGQPMDIHEVDRNLMGRAVEQLRQSARSAQRSRRSCHSFPSVLIGSSFCGRLARSCGPFDKQRRRDNTLRVHPTQEVRGG